MVFYGKSDIEAADRYVTAERYNILRTVPHSPTTSLAMGAIGGEKQTRYSRILWGKFSIMWAWMGDSYTPCLRDHWYSPPEGQRMPIIPRALGCKNNILAWLSQFRLIISWSIQISRHSLSALIHSPEMAWLAWSRAENGNQYCHSPSPSLGLENDSTDFHSLPWWKSFSALLNKTCWFSALINEILQPRAYKLNGFSPVRTNTLNLKMNCKSARDCLEHCISSLKFESEESAEGNLALKASEDMKVLLDYVAKLGLQNTPASINKA